MSADTLPDFGSPKPKQRMQFRLGELLLFVAGASALFCLLGPLARRSNSPIVIGLIALALFSILWWAIRARRWIAAGVWGGVLFLLVLCLLPLLFAPTHGSLREMECSNNLKAIAIALHSYHDKYGSLPPAYVADENGKPMHSWRVLILPQLGETGLHERYRFSKRAQGWGQDLLSP